MAHILPDTKSVIAEFGGVSAVAPMFGVSEKAVWNWRATNRFPARLFFEMRDELQRRRKSAPEALWRPLVKRPASDATLPQVVSPAGA